MRRAPIVIIGAGPAGCAAAVQCKRLGIAPLLMDQTGRAGGLVANGFCVENYPGLQPTDGPGFARLMGAHLERFQIPVERAQVTGVEPSAGQHIVRGDFGRVTAEVVLLATGTVPLHLELPGVAQAEGRMLFYEVRELLASRESSPDRVGIIGGGEAALDYALTLSSRGSRVTLFVRGPDLRAAGRLVELAAASPGIQIQFQTTPRAVTLRADGIELELNQEGRLFAFAADAALAAIGRRPVVRELVRGLDVTPCKGVSTHLPGLFVAGDARSGSLGQAGMAVGDGLAAAAQAFQLLRAREHR